jgi:hypothetical protein
MNRARSENLGNLFPGSEFPVAQHGQWYSGPAF